MTFTKQTQAKNSLRPKSQRLVLEPRIVFDAVLPVMGAEIVEYTDQISTETFAPVEAPAIQSVANAPALLSEDDQKTLVDRALIEGALATTKLAANEIIFIDAKAADLKLYLNDYPNAEVVLLDANRDGVEQMAAALAGRTGIESIHILSHGSSGQLNLGNGVFNLTSLQGEHADELAVIKAALSVTADILIYGCDVAQGQAGLAFIDALQASTGADIAASSNNTGATALGADWVLEAQVGTVAAAALVARDWQHVLADTDGDSIDDAVDIDDDNDGILDATEYRGVTLNVVSVLPAGTHANQSGTGLRIADSTGQYFVDIYRHTASSAGATNTFNATSGLIAGGTSVESTEFVQLVYTTANSPTAWQMSRVTINSINSLTPGPGAGGVRDAYVWSELGTWTPLGTGGTSSAGAVVSINTLAADDVGAFVRNDPDGGNVLTDIGQFTTVTAQDATLSDVLLNMVGGGNGHNAQFDPNLPVTTMSLYVFNSGGGGMAWNFLPQMTVQVPVDTDGDGVANHLDLDSDNDGISDLFESTAGTGDALADINKNGTISLTEATTAGAVGDGDADNDGLLDIFDANLTGITGSVGNTPINTDGDSRADFLDLDSDNDGIADTIEARLSVGYVTNDGNVNNDDADGDGVIGLFDATNAVGGTFGGNLITPVNTDALGAPYTPDATSVTFTGKPARETFESTSGVDNISVTTGNTGITRLLTTDASSARLSDSADRFALDIGRRLADGTAVMLPAGATITIVARRTNNNAGNTLRVSQSSDGFTGATLTNTSNLAFAATNTYQTLTYTLTAATRFIDIGFNRVGGNLDVDSVAWSYSVATSGSLYDYIDSDSDNDGVTDKLESGLTLTGVDTNKDGIDDSVGASYTDPDGNTNAPLGTTNGLKNNDAISTDVDFRSLNIGGVNVSNLVVNEGSDYAVFTLSRVAPALTAVDVKLTLQTGDGDPATNDAIIGTDTGTQIQVFNGAAWVNYTAGVNVSVPAGAGTLLVRVAIANDNPTVTNPTAIAVFEGPELFRLVATSTSAVSGGGYGTILDDGTGNVWLTANNTSTPSIVAATTLDDDRPLAISSVTVNEASPFAVFSVAGIAGTPIRLNLGTTGTGASHAILGTDTGTGAAALQVSSNGGAWTNYTAGNTVNLDANGELLVRAAVSNDTSFEGAETFTLNGTIVGNGISTFGTGTIIDDGTGDVFLAANLTADPNLPGDVGYPVALDDDRPLSVSNANVTEGVDTYAIFTVTGAAGHTVTLATAASGAAPATAEIDGTLNNGEDFGNGGTEFSLDGGLTWEPYAAESDITIPAGGTFQVRVQITNDTTSEPVDETFALTATYSSSAIKSAVGTGTIKDGNQAPVDGDETNSVTEDITLTVLDGATGDLLNNTVDPDNDPVTITGYSIFGVSGTQPVGSLVTIAGVGGLTINSNGSYSFAPATNFIGAIPLVTYTVSDGKGGIDTSTLQLSMTAVNDRPNLTVPVSVTVTEDVAAALTGIGFSDIDAGAGSVIVTLSVGAGTISATTGGGVTVGGTATARTLTGSIADINTFIAGSNATYTTALNATASQTLTVTINDQGNTGSDPGTSGTATSEERSANVTINVTAVNDAPVATADTRALLENATVTANALTGVIQGAGTDTDVDNTSASLLVSGVVVGAGAVTQGTGVASALTGSYGTLTLNADGGYTYAANLAANEALAAGALVTDTYTYTVKDPGNLVSNTTTLSFSVTGVNDAPVNTVPASYSTNEDISVALSGLQISDVDAAGPVTVTLSVPSGSGTISAAGAGGVTVTGSGSTSIILSGTVAQINNYLNTPANLPSYTPANNANGAVTLTMLTNDGSGVVLTQTASDTITINIAAVSDAPTGTSSSIPINEDAPYTLTASDFGFADTNDAPAANTLLNVIVTSLPPSTQGVYRLGGVAISNNQVISIADINAGLLSFAPALNVNGAGLGTLGFRVQDNGGTANGGVDTSASSNTLAFNIDAVNDTVVVGGLTDLLPGVADAQVKESDLSTGSTPAGTGENTTGTFNLGPANALASFTLNGGTSITLADLVASNVTPIVRSGSNGTLTLTGYNSTTGVVSYSYSLTSAPTNAAAVVNDSFAIVITDVDGDTASAGALAINIVDDAPIANADVDETINFAGTLASEANGNVVTGIGGPGTLGPDLNNADGVADAIGADTTASPVVGVAVGNVAGPVSGNLGTGLTGSSGYGVLTLNADGNYNYVPNYTTSTAVANLAPGATLQETFTYTVQDSDGDKATTTLTVTIVGVPAVTGLNDGAVAGSDGSVLESNLGPAGAFIGTNAAGTGEVLSGTFQLASPVYGVNELTVAGTTISSVQLLAATTASPIIIVGTHGTLTITGYTLGAPPTDVPTLSFINGGTVSYTYTLTSAPNAIAAVSESFAVSMIDGVGVNTSVGPIKQLNIAIIDDAPIAVADVTAVTESISTTASTVSGNVFSNMVGTSDQIGADGFTGNPVTAVVNSAMVSGTLGLALPGLYGSIILNASGSYTYTVNDADTAVNALQVGQTLTDTFTYAITDKDGDVATTTLIIAIKGANDAPVAVADTLSTGEDTALVLNLAGNDTDVDSTTVSVKSIHGTLLTPGMAQTIAVPNGSVAISAGGVVTFTPTNNSNATASFSYVLQDGNGGETTGNVNISVAAINDAPVNSLPASFTTLEDNSIVLSNLQISDTDAGSNPVTVTLSVSTGKLTAANAGGVTVTGSGATSMTLAGTVAQINSFLSTGVRTPVYIPVSNANGSVTFTMVTNDGGNTGADPGLTGTLTSEEDTDIRSIDIIPVDDTPTNVSLTHDATNDTGISTTDSLTNNPSPAITGTGAPGDTITLYAPDTTTVLGTVVVGSSGTWSIDPTSNYLVEGLNTLSVTAKDANGNEGAAAPVAVALDTVAPIVAVAEQGDRIKTAAEATSAAGAITVQSEAGSTSVVTFTNPITGGTVSKTITNDGTALAVVLSAADLATLGDGAIEVATVTTDLAGNITTSPDTADGDFTLDTVAPNLPTGALTHNSVNDTGVSNTDSITGNISPEISGIGTPSDTITLFDKNGNAIGQALVAADGTWSINPVGNYLENGLNNLTVIATDPAGNICAPVTISVILDNSLPTAIDFAAAESAENNIAVVLAGVDEIGAIVSVTVSSVPPAYQGTLKLENGTPIAAGAVLTPQQAASLVFVPRPNFQGTATILFFVTDDQGLNSPVALAELAINEVRVQAELLVAQPNVFASSLDPNRPDPFVVRSPVIPIGMPEDLFVIHSVRESAVRIAQSSNFGVFNVDTPTRGELDNLTYDLKGLPVGMDPTLFVQHAVRSLPITQEPRLFVQNAVRQSQLESTMRGIGVGSFNTATNGISSLFSPFDLGSMNGLINLSIDGVNGEFAEKTSKAPIPQVTELASDPGEETVLNLNKLDLPVAKEIEIKIATQMERLAKLMPVDPKSVGAVSFANQLNAASKKFKANNSFSAN